LRGLSLINKLLFLINSILLIGQLLSYLAPFVSPNVFWPIAFFGLLFPIFFLLNLFFLVFWLIQMKRQFWANLIVLIIGLNSISKTIGNGEKTSVENIENSFSIMSYNVRLFNAYNWIKEEEVKEKIFDLFKERNVDILCIQEFYAPEKLPKMDFKHQHIGLQNKKSQWHMAIYSQFPQIRKGTVSIEGERMNNTCIFSDVIISTDTIRVYNIHLASNWFDKNDLAFIENPEINKDAIKKGVLSIAKRLKISFKKRALQVEVIKNHMNDSPYPIVVCGDFNDTPNSFSYQKIVNGLNDSFLQKGSGFGSTFLGKIPFLRIDYILHSPNVKIQSFTTHKGKLSDHKAIESSLAM
jgi:endonuclease/exonuclease/phosphatase family metal-dependent hydrolase